jgi:hypothetical protein
MGALARGLWQGVDGCVGTRTTYEQFSFFQSAMTLALVTFAVEKMISFLAKVHAAPREQAEFPGNLKLGPPPKAFPSPKAFLMSLDLLTCENPVVGIDCLPL